MPFEIAPPQDEKHGFVIVAPDMRCNNNCLFCYDKDSPDEGLESVDPAELLDKTLAEAEREGIRRIGVSGGEPTIYPGLLGFAKKLRDRGLSISVLTNGRALKDMDMLESLLDAGVDHFHISVHSDQESTHDAVTRAKGSFRETLRGLENIREARSKRSFELTVTHVMHQLNYQRLKEFAAFISEFKPYYVLLSYSIVHTVSPDGMRSLLVSLEDIMPRVLEACDIFQRLGQKVYIDNIPPCMMRGREKLCLDYQKTNHLNIIGLKMLGRAETKRYKAVHQSINSHERTYTDLCDACAIKPYCGGLLRTYADHFASPGVLPYSGREIRDRLASPRATAC